MSLYCVALENPPFFLTAVLHVKTIISVQIKHQMFKAPQFFSADQGSFVTGRVW